MNLPLGTAFGLAAGLAGAALWAAIAWYANLEIGWLAWGIGAAVGLACAAGARVGTEPEDGRPATGPILGFIAVAITLLSICGGKYALVEAQVQQMLTEFRASTDEQLAAGFPDEMLVSYLADEAAASEHGDDWRERYDWPEGIDPTTAATESEYPAELWSPAQERWDAMSGDDRAAFKAQTESDYRDRATAFANDYAQQVRQEGFLATFGVMDLVFFGLAIVTAWGIAAASPDGETPTDGAHGGDSIPAT